MRIYQQKWKAEKEKSLPSINLYIQYYPTVNFALLK